MNWRGLWIAWLGVLLIALGAYVRWGTGEGFMWGGAFTIIMGLVTLGVDNSA